MASWQQVRDAQFAKLVDLATLPTPEADRGVVTTWPDIGEILGLEGWRQAAVDTWYQDGGGVREWVLTRGQERLSVKIFVASAGVGPARAFAKRLVVSPTTPEIPALAQVAGETMTFLSLPGNIGVRRHDLLRLYRNIVVELRAFETDLDVGSIADWLQMLAEQHGNESLSAGLPPLREPEFPLGLLSGMEIGIAVPAAPDPHGSFAGERYQIHVRTDGDAVDFIGFGDREARFLLRQAGRGTIRVAAVDLWTLLAKEIATTLEVRLPVGEDRPAPG